MSHLENYNQYLIKHVNTLINYIKSNNIKYNISILVDLKENINNSHGDKLELYAEQLDKTIAMIQNEFGYIHIMEHNSIQL